MIPVVVLLLMAVAVYFILRQRGKDKAPGPESAGPGPPGPADSSSEPPSEKTGREELKDLLEVSAEAVRFDFLTNPSKPEAQVILRIMNQSKYDVLVEKINWQITIGAKAVPSARGSSADAFLLLPQAFRNNLLFRADLDHVEASHVSHSRMGLISVGHIEGAVSGRVQQAIFEKKFLLPNVSCLVAEEKRTLTNMYIDPSHLDPLTGLLNRKFLTENMQTIVDTATPEAPVSFVMIDIDDFKKINDEHGHLIGDDVLKAVAGKMRTTVGERGFSIRYAGDEFSILLRSCQPQVAKHLAEELRSFIAGYMFKVSQGVLQITVSMGIATLSERADYTVLIQMADDLLRLSKKTGKNRLSDRIE